MMKDIQIEYLELLINISVGLKLDNVHILLDQIKVFWLKRRKKLDFIIGWLDNESYNISYFTAFKLIDSKSIDLVSFLLSADYHVIDDPLLSSLLTSTIQDEDISKYFFKNVKEIIDNNIDIITNQSKNFWVLPIRFIYSDLSDNLNWYEETVNELFISLFKNIKTLEEYFNTCSTSEDIDNELNMNAKKMLVLTDNENNESTFLEKFELLKSSIVSNFYKDLDDINLFYIQMKSYFIQALDIVMTSVNSKMFPFIRAYTPFYNFQNIIQNFLDEPRILLISVKSYMSFTLNRKIHNRIKNDLNSEELFNTIRSDNFINPLKTTQLISPDDSKVNLQEINESIDKLIDNLNL